MAAWCLDEASSAAVFPQPQLSQTFTHQTFHNTEREGQHVIPTRYITNFHCGPSNLNDPLSILWSTKCLFKGRKENPWHSYLQCSLILSPERLAVSCDLDGESISRSLSSLSLLYYILIHLSRRIFLFLKHFFGSCLNLIRETSHNTHSFRAEFKTFFVGHINLFVVSHYT